jgi:hypothetical protein
MKKVIQKILKEEVKVPLIIRRNVDFDLLDREFNIALDIASERFREKKSKLNAITPEKFGILVTSDLMVELCYRYENFCLDGGLYDTLWEFIKKYYFKQTTKRFYDIMFGDINESILKEETDDMTEIIYVEFDTVFDTLDLHYYSADRRFPDIMYGKWYNKNNETVFSRNNWGTFWIHDCKPYRELRFFTKLVSLPIEEFDDFLVKYLNKKYEEVFKLKPIKSVGDEYNCLDE